MNSILINNNRLTYIISILIILLSIFRNSWLPGATALQGKEIYIILLSTLLISVLCFDFKNYISFAFFEKGNKYFVLMTLLILVSVIGYNRQEISRVFNLVYLSTFFSLMYIYFFKIPLILTQSKKNLKMFLNFTSLTGFTIAVVGIVMFLTGTSPIAKYSFSTHSIIVHPNFVSYIYTISFITTLYYHLAYKQEFTLYKRVFSLFALFLISIALLFTYSRGGYIGALVGTSVLLVFYLGKRSLLFIPILSIAAVIILPSFFSAKGSGSFLSRVFLLIPAFHMITASREALLWGYGTFENMTVYKKYMTIDNITEQDISDPHNSFLRLIMMFGLLFTMIFLFFLIKLLIKTFSLLIRTNDKEMKLLLAFLMSITLALLAMGTFDSGLVAPVFFHVQFFLVFLGLMYIYTKDQVRE